MKLDFLELLRSKKQLAKGFVTKTTAATIEVAKKLGMIPLAELKDGRWYLGYCRNSHLAMWSSREAAFVYLRLKGDVRREALRHPENDDSEPGLLLDLFVPIAQLPDQLNPCLDPEN